MPRARGRGDGPGADGRHVALRERPGPDLQHDRGGAAQRDAVVGREADGRADLEAGGVRAQPVGTGEQVGRARARRPHADDDAGELAAAGEADQGPRRAAAGRGDGRAGPPEGVRREGRVRGRSGFILRAFALAMPLLGGCAGAQAALDPAGPQSRSIAGVWWFFFGTTAAVYAIVMLALGVALVHGGRRE